MPLSERVKNIISFLNGFRKFTIMVLLITIATSFRLTGFLDGAEMVDLLKATGIAYMATNGIEHMAKSVVEWVKRKM